MSRAKRAREFMRDRMAMSRGKGCFWCDRLPEEPRRELYRCVFVEGFSPRLTHEWIRTEFKNQVDALLEPYRRRQSLEECIKHHEKRWRERYGK